METLKTENEETKTQEGIRKIQQSLHDALEQHQFWGLDQKIHQIQRSLQLTQRI